MFSFSPNRPTHFSVNAKDLKHQNIRYSAMESDNANAEQQLSPPDLPLNTIDEWGRTPLITAVQAGNPAAVEHLLSLGAVINDVGSRGRTALHEAALHGNKTLTLLLAKHGADIQAQDYYGHTPLHTAAIAGQEETISLLLRLGADLSTENCDGYNVPECVLQYGRDPLPLLRACRHSQLSLGEFFYTPELTELAVRRSGESARSLLRALDCPEQEIPVPTLGVSFRDALKATPEQRRSLRGTQVIKAVREGNSSLLRFLLENGYHPDAKGDEPFTPLAEAMLNSRENLAQLLLSAGADPTFTVPGSVPVDYTHGEFRLSRACIEAIICPMKAFLKQQNEEAPDERDALSLAVLIGKPLLAEQILQCAAKRKEKRPDACTQRSTGNTGGGIFRSSAAAHAFYCWQFRIMEDTFC